MGSYEIRVGAFEMGEISQGKVRDIFIFNATRRVFILHEFGSSLYKCTGMIVLLE